MNKWTKAARLRLTEIRQAEGLAADMRTVAAALAQLPPGQLKKLLTEDVLAVLEKYGVTAEDS